MDHLDQALNKSKLQQQGDGRTVGARVGTANAPNQIAYYKTTVARLDPKVLESNHIVAHQVTHGVTDLFRSLRAQVLRSMSKRRATTIGITSLGDGEGKTTLAINLALAVSMDVNQTVLLVDADLRSPSVAKYLGIKVKHGLGDVLSGVASIEECLVNPGVPRLCILPSHDSIDNSAELLSSPQMLRLVRELKGRYADRLIIFDLPPMQAVADTIGFLPLVEATLLVVRDGAVLGADLKRVTAVLSDHNLIGTVLNAAA